MISNLNDSLNERLRDTSRYLTYLVIFIGICVLVGWQLDIQFFRSPLPGKVAMNPLTSLLFILSGLTFLLITNYERNVRTKWIGYLLTSVIFTAACLKLLGILISVDTGIDHFLFSEKLFLEKFTGRPNRMAPNTAFDFSLIALILFLIQIKTSNYDKKILLIQRVSIIIGLLSILSILGYMYGVPSFYGVLKYIPMAIHTAFCFLLISLMFLFFFSDQGIMHEFTSKYAGSHIASLLIPGAIVVPAILGYICLLGYKAGFFPTEFGFALLVLSTVIVFILLIWHNSVSLNKKDKIKAEIEEELVIVNKELEAFSYSVSHDLRTPLRIISGYAGILEDDLGTSINDDIKQSLQAIKLSTKKMNVLIDDLLLFSKLGNAEIKKEDINFNKLVEEVFSDLNRSIEHKAIIKIHMLHQSKGDSQLIKQVMVNLISNAIKYSSKKTDPLIEICSAIKDNEVIYTVKDNGDGFDMQYVSKLFGVFQRLHSDVDFEGTGLGLAIVNRIVTKHGGTVYAEGEPQKGASFSFSLPINQ